MPKPLFQKANKYLFISFKIVDIETINKQTKHMHRIY